MIIAAIVMCKGDARANYTRLQWSNLSWSMLWNLMARGGHVDVAAATLTALLPSTLKDLEGITTTTG